MAVTVSTGETHHRYCRVMFGGVNMSGDARTLGAIGLDYPPADATGWSDGLTNNLLGIPTVNFGPFQARFSTTVAATGPIEPGSHIELSAITADIATVAIGIAEAPTIGAPAFSSHFEQTSYTTAITANDNVMVNADWTHGVGTVGSGITGGFGQLLAVGTSVSSTTNNGSVDNGGSTANGAIGVIHITQAVGAMGSTDYAMKIEHGTDDSAWATLMTFSGDGSAVTSQWDDTSATGTVNQYTRLVLTKTAGNDLICWVNLIRL